MKSPATEKLCGACDHLAQSARERREETVLGICRCRPKTGPFLRGDELKVTTGSLCIYRRSHWTPIGGRARRFKPAGDETHPGTRASMEIARRKMEAAK